MFSNDLQDVLVFVLGDEMVRTFLVTFYCEEMVNTFKLGLHGIEGKEVGWIFQHRLII